MDIMDPVIISFFFTNLSLKYYIAPILQSIPPAFLCNFDCSLCFLSWILFYGMLELFLNEPKGCSKNFKFVTPELCLQVVQMNAVIKITTRGTQHPIQLKYLSIIVHDWIFWFPPQWRKYVGTGRFFLGDVTTIVSRRKPEITIWRLDTSILAAIYHDKFV
jgi:hypothetical protein